MSRPRRWIALAVWSALAAASARPAAAEVVRVVIDRREPVLDGRSWGPGGPYEKLIGRIFFAFDPESPANAPIVDLHLAPRNADGKVEAWAEFVVLQPSDPERRRGVAWLEVSNRGGLASLRYFNRAAGSLDPTTAAEMGDGLLFRQGLTVIWVGWQWDVPAGEGLLGLHVPMAREPDGTPITGLARADWRVDAPVETLALGHRGHRSYVPVDPAHPDNVLSVRDGRDEPRQVIPRDRWRFLAPSEGPEAGRHVLVGMDGGFEAGRIYELVYRAADPRLVGLGLAAIRDVMSYARYGLDSDFPVRMGVAFGVSQTGRFLRHFLYQGFNTDEGGRKVFDGMLVHTAGAGRGSFNHRFAQPSRDAHRYSAFFYPTDVWPFASRTLTDPVTGVEDGLAAATRAEHRPYVLYTNTGYEYWGRAASLIHTTPDGLRDVSPLETERVYHLSGGQHFVGAFPPPEGSRLPGASVPAFRGDPVDFLLTLRALSVRLVEWVADGKVPPASRYPTVSEGTLVRPEGVAFPSLPGVPLPDVIHEAYRAEYGPRFRTEGIVDLQPPRLGETFPSQVSQVDGLGNEVAGVRPVELRVPLATYAPWNLRGPDAPGAPGELSDFVGTFVPLAATEAERRTRGDPRPSIERLYRDRAAYLRRVEAAVQALVDEGFLLGEDAERATERAEALWRWIVEEGGGG